MGFLTTITIHNDALGEFEQNPEKFAKAIFAGINQANRENQQIDIGFKNYCNYITVEPSRHADAETLYFHGGNTVINIGPHENQFIELMQKNPVVAAEFLKSAKRILKQSQEKYNKINKQK